MILVFVTLGNPQAIAKKPECIGAEMALLYNLKEMSFTLEVLVQDDSNQIDFLISRYSDFVGYGNTSSPNAVSLKVQIDALKSKVANYKRQIASLDAQSKKILTKCKETTVDKLQASKNRKICTSNEKKAINSVIASFRSVQDKKQNWDGKKRVAEAWMNDLTKPDSIRATAMSDFRKYSRYYEIEEVKESFVVSQFEFLNAGCRNSGLYLPKAFTPPTPKPQPDPNTGVYLEDWRFNYNSLKGGFTSERQSDGSVKIQCKDGNGANTKWDFPIGLNLEGAKLLLTGSRESDGVYNQFTLNSFRAKDFLVPVERVKVFGAKMGRQDNYDTFQGNEIAGKSIGFSSNGSICGLTTEAIGNLNQTFASDVKTAGLFLLIRTDRNPGRIWPPGNQLAILIGSFAELSAEEKAAAEKAAEEKAAAEKASSFVCIPSSNCPIGSTGPGGGIVFYDAGSQQSWGRYLEFAPASWRNAGASFPWCGDKNVLFAHLAGSITDVNLKASVGYEIGKGKANTDLMLANCGSGAGHAAREYRGGNKSDWYLPSRDELNELCKLAKNQVTGKVDVPCQRGTSPESSAAFSRGGFSNDYYWSSSESGRYSEFGCKGINDTTQCRDEAQVALFQTFVLGDTGWQRLGKKIDTLKVRPIRAF